MRHVVQRIAVCIALTGVACLAQTEAPAFETASIRSNTGNGDPEILDTPGSLTVRNATLRLLIQWAYDVPRVQVEGPAWLMENRFDVVAKAADPANEARLRLMLRSLLAERFGVKLHTEARVMPVYAMTLAKGGPKFQESETEGPFVIDRKNPLVLSAHHARMSDVAQGISGELSRPVVDATGLTGRYEIHMDVTPYLARAGGGASGDGQLDVMSILFTGLQDLLGLKLEPRKESVDMLVVDHAEKLPTEN